MPKEITLARIGKWQVCAGANGVKEHRVTVEYADLRRLVWKVRSDDPRWGKTLPSKELDSGRPEGDDRSIVAKVKVEVNEGVGRWREVEVYYKDHSLFGPFFVAQVSGHDKENFDEAWAAVIFVNMDPH